MAEKGVQWKINNILKGKTSDQLLEEVKDRVEKFKSYKKDLNENITSEKLKEIIKLNESISVLLTGINAYYSMAFAVNNQDSEILAKLSFLKQFNTDVSNSMRFFSLWFMDLNEKTAERLIEGEKEYHYYLEQVRKDKPYTKSEEIENIISLKSITSGAYDDLYDIFTNAFTFDFNGEKNLPQEKVTGYFQSEDPKLREEAYKVVMSKYVDNSTILSEMYKNIVLDWHNEGIKIRKYKHPISIKNHDNDIPDEVVEAMLRVIRRNVKLFSDYFKLKYEIHDKKGDKYPYSRYHLHAPYKLKSKKKYPYEESKKLVLETLEKFDSRFYEAGKKIFDKEHVDSHPRLNKRSGAFCYGLHSNETPFIMLNHTDNLKDVFTMMHELGHGIHDIFASNQVDLLYHPTLPVAETASVFGEMILTDRLLNEAKDDNEKIFLITRLLNSEYGTIIRQAYFTLFEKFAHNKIKDGITKEELEEEWMKNLKEQFGDMEIPDVFRNEWNYIPHFHHSPFYCYAYTWGNLCVLSFYAMYREQGKEFIDNYIDFLSSGGGASPVDLLKTMNVDASKEEFWQKGFDIIKEQIEQLKEMV